MTIDQQSVTSSVGLRLSPGDPWQVDVLPTVDGPLEEELWPHYAESMVRLQETTPVRHLLSRKEFAELMRNPLVTKIVVHRREPDGELKPAGLTIVSNKLDTVFQASPEFFARRWPELYARGQIWYVGFVAVFAAFVKTTAVGVLLSQVASIAAQEGGIIALDFADSNDERQHFTRGIPKLTARYGHPLKPSRLDAQAFWAYEIAPSAAEPAK